MIIYISSFVCVCVCACVCIQPIMYDKHWQLLADPKIPRFQTPWAWWNGTAASPKSPGAAPGLGWTRLMHLGFFEHMCHDVSLHEGFHTWGVPPKNGWLRMENAISVHDLWVTTILGKPLNLLVNQHYPYWNSHTAVYTPFSDPCVKLV